MKKKITLGFLAIGIILCLSSCSKSCSCKQTAAGDNTFSKEWTVNLDGGEVCSDFETTSGTKCTPIF